eukprot:XP_001707963.1 Hypothetical protein GL50803_31362 [Giardia lamblia ATCC 50803]
MRAFSTCSTTYAERSSNMCNSKNKPCNRRFTGFLVSILLFVSVSVTVPYPRIATAASESCGRKVSQGNLVGKKLFVIYANGSGVVRRKLVTIRLEVKRVGHV